MKLAIILIPILVAMAMLNSTSPARVMIKVYLPCVMLFPVYLTQNFGGFALTDTSLVAMMLCILGLFRWYRSLRFTFLDLLVGLYAFGAFYSDASTHALNIGVYSLIQNVATCVFPYCIGRTLIEQTGSRREFAKTFVLCLALVAFVNLYEYRMASNLFQMAVERITHAGVGWSRQMRWGFGRTAGPYGHAIIAGMMFSTGLLFHFWLVGTKSWDASKALRLFRTSRRAKVITGVLAVGFFMTQSRGPWIGFVFGAIMASVGFARDRRRAVKMAVAALIVIGLVVGVGLKSYVSERALTAENTDDPDQQNAAYRANLYSVYKPLIDQGGLWGWGSPSVLFMGTLGWIAGQTSIDNGYILVAMGQGYFGITVFVLIFLTSIYKTIRLCATLRSRQDVLFAYCLLGALLAMAFTLTTTGLVDPMIQVAFLLFGWTHSVRPTEDPQAALAPAATGRFAFQRVFA